MNNIDIDIKKEFELRNKIKLSELLKKYDSFELNESLSRLCRDKVINATYEEDPSFMIMNKKMILRRENENGKSIN